MLSHEHFAHGSHADDIVFDTEDCIRHQCRTCTCSEQIICLCPSTQQTRRNSIPSGSEELGYASLPHCYIIDVHHRLHEFIERCPWHSDDISNLSTSLHELLECALFAIEERLDVKTTQIIAEFPECTHHPPEIDSGIHHALRVVVCSQEVRNVLRCRCVVHPVQRSAHVIETTGTQCITNGTTGTENVVHACTLPREHTFNISCNTICSIISRTKELRACPIDRFYDHFIIR